MSKLKVIIIETLMFLDCDCQWIDRRQRRIAQRNLTRQSCRDSIKWISRSTMPTRTLTNTPPVRDKNDHIRRKRQRNNALLTMEESPGQEQWKWTDFAVISVPKKIACMIATVVSVTKWREVNRPLLLWRVLWYTNAPFDIAMPTFEVVMPTFDIRDFKNMW